MRHAIGVMLGLLLLIGAFVSESHAATRSLACGGDRTIKRAIERMNPGDVLLVSGVCTENVVINSRVTDITLDGQGVATIAGATTAQATIQVRGRGITIQHFQITAGADGILVSDGGTALIDGNTIQSNTSYGVQVTRASSAKIVNNVIQNNAVGGIFVSLNSAAEIGVFGGSDTVASPNTIQNNPGDAGVHVTRSSSARIIGNTISGNGVGGVLLIRGAQADIASNAIDGNTGDGISVGQNSTASLGRNSGTGLFASPNTTDTANNTGFGVACFSGGFLGGRLGTLDGNSGASTIDATCVGTLN